MKPIPIALAAIVMALLGSAIVMQQLRLTSLGYDIGKQEALVRALQEQNRQASAELSRLRSYNEVERMIAEHGLPLEPPSADSTPKPSPKPSASVSR